MFLFCFSKKLSKTQRDPSIIIIELQRYNTNYAITHIAYNCISAHHFLLYIVLFISSNQLYSLIYFGAPAGFQKWNWIHKRIPRENKKIVCNFMMLICRNWGICALSCSKSSIFELSQTWGSEKRRITVDYTKWNSSINNEPIDLSELSHNYPFLQTIIGELHANSVLARVKCSFMFPVTLLNCFRRAEVGSGCMLWPGDMHATRYRLV